MGQTPQAIVKNMQQNELCKVPGRDFRNKPQMRRPHYTRVSHFQAGWQSAGYLANASSASQPNEHNDNDLGMAIRKRPRRTSRARRVLLSFDSSQTVLETVSKKSTNRIASDTDDVCVTDSKLLYAEYLSNYLGDFFHGEWLHYKFYTEVHCNGRCDLFAESGT